MAVQASRRFPLATRDDSVHAVRRFNRFYTRQIGVLQEHLLRSRLSLTEVRVLYELAHRDSITAVDLRRLLALDRGYLSRMLNNFEKQGWIKTAPSATDRRRILLSLTGKGRKVFAPLDQRSSEEVAAMLAKVSPSQRRDLLNGMRRIESILHPGPAKDPTYVLRRHRSGDMGWVVHEHGVLYAREYGYDERFEALVAAIVAEFIDNLDPARDRCWIAEKDGEAVGSIFLVHQSKSTAKLRLLLVDPSARGLGIGKDLVSTCISFAREVGYRKVVLWTQSELHGARHLYQQAGFVRVAEEPH